MKTLASSAFAAALAAAVLSAPGRAQECPAPPENDTIDFGASEPLAVASGETNHAFTVEIADTPEETSRGLMYRPEIAPDAGMLFVFPDVAPHGFYMRNTCASLDILYLREDGRIASIVRDAVPMSQRNLPSPGPVKGVLEIAGGRARELGIEPGDTVVHAAFGGDVAAALAGAADPDDAALDADAPDIEVPETEAPETEAPAAADEE